MVGDRQYGGDRVAARLMVVRCCRVRSGGPIRWRVVYVARLWEEPRAAGLHHTARESAGCRGVCSRFVAAAPRISSPTRHCICPDRRGPQDAVSLTALFGAQCRRRIGSRRAAGRKPGSKVDSCCGGPISARWRSIDGVRTSAGSDRSLRCCYVSSASPGLVLTLTAGEHGWSPRRTPPTRRSVWPEAAPESFGRDLDRRT